MKIVVLGATGTTGKHVVEDALTAGYEVIAYVRNPDAVMPRVGLTVRGGSVEDEVAMRAVFEGADAVISCLGVRPSIKTLFRATDFQQRVLPKIISAINSVGVRRFVLMSSFGVGATRAKASFIPRVIVYTLFGGRLFADKALAEQILSSCKANWTAVYPVILREGAADSAWDLLPLDKVRKVPGMPILSFATVARALVNLIPNGDHPKEKLLLTIEGGWR